MKEKLIELFTKVGNETDTFAPFVTSDQFDYLADEIVKLCNLHDVVGRSEQLLAFAKWIQENGNHITPEKQVRYYEIDSQ